MRKSHSQWQQEQEAGEEMPRDPQAMAAERLLRDVDHILDQADEIDDGPVKRDLMNRAAIDCLKLCILLKRGEI